MENEKNWVYDYTGSLYDIPEQPGVYLIVFENKKRYVGSTNNLHGRITRHLGCLCGKNHDSTKWYALAREENNLPQYKVKEIELKKGRKRKTNQELEKEKKEENRRYFKFLRQTIMNKIQISFCICDDYGEYENILLESIRERDLWYNSQFHSNNKKR